jgi:sterol desaturase/sphingolipid hydroxylase (fatty acid hydroxylase superfamily)
VNAAAIFGMYGAIELFWYVKRKQGTRFKYNAKFPSDQPSDVFWFK